MISSVLLLMFDFNNRSGAFLVGTTSVIHDTNYIGYTRRHLQQRVEKHKHSVIGKHNVRPSNFRENFTIVINKCRSKLECLIFEMSYIREKRLKPEHLSGLNCAKLFVLNEIHANLALSEYLFYTYLCINIFI